MANPEVAPTGAPRSFHVQHEDLGVAVFDALGFDDAGGSLGGGVVIHVDRQQPGRARRLMGRGTATGRGRRMSTAMNTRFTATGCTTRSGPGAIRRSSVPTGGTRERRFGGRPGLMLPSGLQAANGGGQR